MPWRSIAAIEMFEGYVLSPLVQRRSVALPPALTIAAQVLLGVLLGVLGVALATPIAAAAMVAIQRLYVEELWAMIGPADRQRPAALHRPGAIHLFAGDDQGDPRASGLPARTLAS